MSRRTLGLDEEIYRYLLEVSLRESEAAAALREETSAHAMANMQVAPEQGQFMALLLRLMGARRVLGIGVFTGYSSLCMAEALPADGRLVACDRSEEYTAVARRYWQRAGVADRIELRLAPALDTLRTLLDEGCAGSFDFAFIDAHKPEYPHYYDHALQLLRPGGLIAIDNVLWEGQPADADVHDEDTDAIRAFNVRLRDDRRVMISLLPIADGLTLALKLPA